MKKYFTLLFVLCFNLFGYEYLIKESSTVTEYYLDNESGVLYFKMLLNGVVHEDYSDSQFYSSLYQIREGVGGFISNESFKDIYTNDSNFLNDLYLQRTTPFLNYLYNENQFSLNNHVVYENYEILYNSDGLAVESVLNGSWAGLYDGPDNSGYLYDEKGDLKYINGVSPSFFESIFNKLMRRFGINLQSIFIKKIFYPLLILIFACVVLRTIIRLAFKAFLIRFYDKKIGQLEKRREKIENA